MPTAENAKIQYEAGQNTVAMSALTDSGDNTVFNFSASPLSRKSGYAPVIRPDGIITGGVVTPAAAGGTDDVDVSALTCYVNGSAESEAATTDVAITRPATAVSKVCSITYDKGTGAIAVVAGTDGSTTAFSETRGAAGGPPLIPTDAIELAQVRVTSNTSAVIAASEIFSVVGTHREEYNYPISTVDYTNGKLTFASALPDIHEGPTSKTVYASYASPIFADLSKATDFVPAENTHSITSTQIYGQTLGASNSTLNQASFTAYLDDGVTDGLVSLKDSLLWFKFFPDEDATPYILTQGKLGLSRSFPAGDQIQAACTISAESASVEKAA